MRQRSVVSIGLRIFTIIQIVRIRIKRNKSCGRYFLPIVLRTLLVGLRCGDKKIHFPVFFKLDRFFGGTTGRRGKAFLTTPAKQNSESGFSGLQIGMLARIKRPKGGSR